jgi:aminoglycoside 2''-phosphotransferase
LFDPREIKITGVFDFGMAGMGDPANDTGNLINFYGESFVRKINRTYPDFPNHLLRARYYAQSLELEWILRGLESGEEFWFTAHLGRARDILA